LSRPFQFVSPLPSLQLPVPQWRDQLLRLEDAGFAAVSVSDHVAAGWAMDPLTALAAAAAMTQRLRLMTVVLNSDIRHPALIYAAAATLGRVSEGRLDLGLGAGWKASEYAALGIPFGGPAERVERLAESVQVIKALFVGESVTFRGTYHQIDDLPVAGPGQRPPPILIAGGGRQILELAGREADLAGIAPVFREGRSAAERIAELQAASAERKIGWLRDAAVAARRDPEAIQLQLNIALAQPDGAELYAEGWLRDVAADAMADSMLRTASPYVLVGDVEACADRLEAVRERFGFSRIRLPGDPDPWASLVARLAGR
jgi:probable F420-dependent oxidoreductase